MKHECLNILESRLSFWKDISDAERENIISNSKLIKYNKSQIVHSADNECLGVIIVLSGELRVYLLSDEGKEVTLYRLDSNNICIMSASCLLKNITFDVFISAEQDTEVLLINSSIFEQLQKENLLIENFALKTATARFSDVIWAMEQMLFYKFETRLAMFLIDESNRINSDTIKLTHEQIAKYIGSAREVVSRTLKIFEKNSVIKQSNGEIAIINKGQLYKSLS